MLSRGAPSQAVARARCRASGCDVWRPGSHRSTCKQGRLLAVVRTGGGEGSGQLQRVLQAIDDLNAQDPRRVPWQGEDLPFELA
jgi:hypothetical protein